MDTNLILETGTAWCFREAYHFRRLFISVMLTFLCSCSALLAQQHTISGYISDGSNGETLIGATISVKGTANGVVTNLYGFYSLTLPSDTYQFEVNYLGFEKRTFSVVLSGNIRRDIELHPSSEVLNEIVITTDVEDENISDAGIGVERIDVKEIETIPVLFGEKDVMKTVQLLPGVKRAGEGNSGFYVRGGGLDQNLILLDEAPVYNPSHLLGFFSVFNSDALKNVTLYKGVIPAEYGGRASSVMDIRMKEGNKKEPGVSGGIGLISSRLTLEAPIVRDKGSFIISGRRTYADLFLKLSRNEDSQDTKLYFYDLNMKANYELNDKNRLYLSGYLGRDNFGFSDRFGIDWGNKTATLRWNHLYSDRLFSNTSLIFSDYSYGFGFGSGDEEVRLKSFTRDWNIKHDFTFFSNNNNTIKFGANAIYHTFQTGNLEAGESSGFTSSTSNQRFGLEGAAYIQNEHRINSKISLNYGLRYSFFNQMGDDTAYTFDDQGEVLSATEYDKWESMQFYHGAEPRISLKYQFNSQSSLKAGYNRNYQYMHLLSNSTSGSPTDLWIPVSNNVRPLIADQWSAGYFRNFKDNMYEFSIETYYKSMQNLIDYKVGADIFLNNTLESELIYGDGHAYGAEFFLKKRKGRFTGWLSYTYSRTFRNFDDTDGGNTFPARQDRIHDVSIVGMYNLSDKVRLSASWVFNTGDAVTFPSGQYTIGDAVVPYYTERNGYRMPDYHRLDLGITIQRKKTTKFESSWNFSVYNAYGRENAYQITFEQNEANPTATEAVQLSLFKWVPSFSYNFKF